MGRTTRVIGGHAHRLSRHVAVLTDYLYIRRRPWACRCFSFESGSRIVR
jgi:hypothetical protein